MVSGSYICIKNVLFLLNGDGGKQLKHYQIPPYYSHRELHTIEPLYVLMRLEL